MFSSAQVLLLEGLHVSSVEKFNSFLAPQLRSFPALGPHPVGVPGIDFEIQYTTAEM